MWPGWVERCRWREITCRTFRLFWAHGLLVPWPALASPSRVGRREAPGSLLSRIPGGLWTRAIRHLPLTVLWVDFNQLKHYGIIFNGEKQKGVVHLYVCVSMHALVSRHEFHLMCVMYVCTRVSCLCTWMCITCACVSCMCIYMNVHFWVFMCVRRCVCVLHVCVCMNEHLECMCVMKVCAHVCPACTYARMCIVWVCYHERGGFSPHKTCIIPRKSAAHPADISSGGRGCTAHRPFPGLLPQ